MPSGLYGVTSKGFSISTPGFSPVSRAWPVPPAGPAAFNAGFDSLGRHNSISVQGFSWLTYSGDDMTLPYESMDTVGISPL